MSEICTSTVGMLTVFIASAIAMDEVHISDINAREAFRKINYISPVCAKTVMGHGFAGYCEALDYLAAL